MIKVSHITKRFGRHVAVNDVSFSVKKGEVVGFLGPNGAGKSTTMRIITGFMVPETGSVSIDNKSVLENPLAVQERIGYMPESNPLYSDMLVSEFLAYSAALKGIASRARKKAFDFSVSATSIGEVFYRPINELSKGFRQRVGLACALLNNPDILILDEPTEGLDPNQRVEVRELIKDLAEDHTVILSTHVLQEVTAMCDRIIIIHRGSLVADGTTGELTKQSKEVNTLVVELEGAAVKEKLKALMGVTKIVLLAKPGPRRFCLELQAKAGTALPILVSEAARDNKWTIWHLSEKRQGLEEVFKELTQA